MYFETPCIYKASASLSIIQQIHAVINVAHVTTAASSLLDRSHVYVSCIFYVGLHLLRCREHLHFRDVGTIT
jgi:hypothetical protein